jgi:hypothetical protein
LRTHSANLVQTAERSEFRGFGVEFWRAASGKAGKRVLGDAAGMHVWDFCHGQRLVCFVSFGHGFANAHADVDEERLYMVGHSRF